MTEEKRAKMTPEEINEKTDHMELELEGKVFLVQFDKEDRVLLRDELDPELVLKIVMSVFSDALKAYADIEDAEFEEVDPGQKPSQLIQQILDSDEEEPSTIP